MTDRNIMVIIVLESYLRNWIESETFRELNKDYNLNYIILQHYWDTEKVKNYGINNYKLLTQDEKRKLQLYKFLTVTMLKFSKKAKGFKIKTDDLKGIGRIKGKILSVPVIYNVLRFAIENFFPVWKELDKLINEIKPELIIMPSQAADSWTIDMILTARKRKIKSLVLINSWDNLVSKGVIPTPPDCLAVWGPQGVKQALNVQNIPREKLVVLGSPRFEMYFEEKPKNSKDYICAYNNIPTGKKIILFASSAAPFDDCSALKILDDEITNNKKYHDYIILYRPHPEKMPRKDEKHIFEYDFKNVYLDKQTEQFYNLSLDSNARSSFSHLNEAKLDYYPRLLNSIDGVVGPPTTLSLEGAFIGVPYLIICYGDNKNVYLTPDKMSEFEHIKEILSFSGVIPCREQESLLACFEKLIMYTKDEDIKKNLIRDTEYILYRDHIPYPIRLKNAVDRLLTCN